MDAAAAAAPGAGGPLLLLPPPPAYTEPALDTAYVADASFSPRAMRPLYGATRLLTELLLPREALPPDVLQVTPSGALLVQGPPEEVGGRVLAHYASPVAVAAATLLFAALLPLAGLLFCCARCCCCRRRPPPPPASRRAKRRAACRRAALGLALAAAATAMLFGVVCAFVTNEYMQEGSDALPGRLRVATMDARLYLNNTRRHMSHLLVTNFHELRDNLEHSLNSTGQLMIAGLKNVSNATVLDKVANLTSMLDSAQQDLHMLHNLTHDAHEAARDLDKELRALRARVDALHKRCKDQHACRDALNASAAAADADFSQLAAAAEAAAAGEGGGAAQAALAADHLQSSVRRAEDELRGLARRVDERVARAAPPLRAALDDLGGAVADYDGELGRALANVSRALDRGADPALGHLDALLARYSRYRYYADAGASAALLLVVLLLALGLLYGFCGKAPLPGDALGAYGGEDCCARATGARWLMLAVAAMFLLGSALALAALAHFAAGLAAQQAVCAPLRPAPRPAPLLALADAWLAPPEERAALAAAGGGPPRDGKRLADALAACHRNRSAYAVLGLSARHNAQELLRLADSPEVRARLARLRSALPEDGLRVQLLTAAARQQLVELGRSAGAAAEDAGDAAVALAAAAARADPEALAARLDAVPADGLPAGAGKELRELADDLRGVQRGALAELRRRADALNATAARLRDRLRLGFGDARLAADAAVRQLEAAQRRFDEGGSQLLVQLANTLANEVMQRLDAHLHRVVDLMQASVGACAPLSRAVNASLVAVCDEVLLPVNGWWVGCGLCLVLFIPALILASCLATQYRRPRADQYIPAGPDAEYLYDAYSDRDNIPLARAGGPAEQLQPIMSDQQQQQACALPATSREGKHISLSAGKKRGQRRYHEGYHDNAAGGGGAYEFPSRRDHDARFSDMAPKHWDLPNGAPPPRYLGPEYERPPPYYYPGPGDSAGRR
ncbi:hypothetical protein R5R35_009104 [Gryllus longicercus]|uniref:Prominin-like protein n=1 Tax=Gryllus longicercus TaxID=2509291 RepID=A0AAN9WDN2_9ORTH